MKRPELLFAFADHREGRLLRAASLSCLETGVGKVAAALALAERLQSEPPSLVVWVGICGADEGGPAVEELCVIGESLLADEGAVTEEGFVSLANMDLSGAEPVPHDRAGTERLAEGLGGLPILRAATVSTCSGLDVVAEAVRAHSGAQVETMESAAASMACARFGVPLVELRCVSNRCGDRRKGGWKIREAAERAQRAALEALELGLFDSAEGEDGD